MQITLLNKKSDLYKSLSIEIMYEFFYYNFMQYPSFDIDKLFIATQMACY